VGMLNIKGGLCPQCRGISHGISTRNKSIGTRNKPISLSRRVAYICFKVLGLISFIEAYLIYQELEASGGGASGLAGVIGISMAALFGIPLVIAISLGPLLSLVIWHDNRLLVLTSITVILIIILAIVASSTWASLLFIYGMACMFIGPKKIPLMK